MLSHMKRRKKREWKARRSVKFQLRFECFKDSSRRYNFFELRNNLSEAEWENYLVIRAFHNIFKVKMSLSQKHPNDYYFHWHCTQHNSRTTSAKARKYEIKLKSFSYFPSSFIFRVCVKGIKSHSGDKIWNLRR